LSLVDRLIPVRLPAATGDSDNANHNLKFSRQPTGKPN